jgi:HEAT repeat protein
MDIAGGGMLARILYISWHPPIYFRCEYSGIEEAVLAAKTIKLRYITIEGFLRDYAQLRKGGLALPVKSPLPLNTRICLNVSVPHIEPVLTLQGTVIKNFAPPRATRLPKTGCMRIGFNGGSREAIKNFDAILRCHEKYRQLPDLAAARYRADTAEMVTAVQTNVRRYIDRILGVKTTGQAVVQLKLFRRILPDLIHQADWPTVLYLTRAVDLAAATTVFFAAASGLPANPLEFVFGNRNDDIVSAYATADTTQRKMIHDIAGRLDTAGIEIMARTLSACPDGRVRKAALSILIKKGALVRNWILTVLDAPGQKWYLKHTALMLLKYVGKKEAEIDRARKLVLHEHPRVREAALNVLITFQAMGAEEMIITALNDTDDGVRRRAMSCLTRLSPMSERVIYHLLAKISVAAQPDRKKAIRQYRKIAHLIKALGAAADIANPAQVENFILTLARKLSYYRKGMFRRLRKSIDSDQSDVLSAAIATLGKIGTAKSESFLEKLAGSRSPQAEPAQAAANHIKLRYIAMLSMAPANAGLRAIAAADRPWATTGFSAAESSG